MFDNKAAMPHYLTMATQTQTTTTANTRIGHGDMTVATDLYRSAALFTIGSMRRSGEFVCIGNVLARMPEYNRDMLNDTLWSLAIEGAL
jgi:hypothetical protein